MSLIILNFSLLSHVYIKLPILTFLILLVLVQLQNNRSGLGILLRENHMSEMMQSQTKLAPCS